MKALSPERFAGMRKQKQYSELGWYFWRMFTSLPLANTERQKASAQFDSLNASEKTECEKIA